MGKIKNALISWQQENDDEPTMDDLIDPQTKDIKECERTQERISRLDSGIAIIRVGAPTEIEMIEKKHRIEDALEAVKSAQEGGTGPGGGAALIQACRNLDVDTETEDQKIGAAIVLKAITAPIKQMAYNSGQSPDIVHDLVSKQENGFGYNFATDKIVNMFDEGIIDPAKVTKVALQNAASAAGTLIMTGYSILEV